MKKAQTVTGKTFCYDGGLSEGLMVYTCDEKGNIKSNGFRIYPDTIEITKKAIIRFNEIPMGSCRDNPAKDSIGNVLRLEHKSSQILCYVIPILTEEGFCTYYKKSNTYYIRLMGN